MKGIIFNLVEAIVRKESGDEAWESLLEGARLEGVYTSLGTYPDEDFSKLVKAASLKFQKPAEAIVRWIGTEAIPLLAERYPDFFKPHRSTRSFLMTLNNVIHSEVRKIYPEADVPVFDFEICTDKLLVMGYRSARKLCAFGEGLIEGAAAYYGEEISLEQPQCMNRGDEKCVFKITFKKPERGL